LQPISFLVEKRAPFRCASVPISVWNWSSPGATSPGPAIANEGLKRNRAGQVVLQLKSPYKDGTTHIVMEPLEFMERTAPASPSDPFPRCAGAQREVAQ
jgi:hypothetical protein